MFILIHAPFTNAAYDKQELLLPLGAIQECLDDGGEILLIEQSQTTLLPSALESDHDDNSDSDTQTS